MSYQLDKNKEIALIKWAQNNCGGGANQIQKVEFSAVPTSGTYTLSIDNETTVDLAFGAAAVDIKTALENLTSLTTVSVAGSYSAGFTVEIEDPASTYVSILRADDSALDAEMTVTMIQEGVPVVPFIMGYPGAERPTLPYGMLNIISNVSEAGEVQEYAGTTDTYTNSFYENFTVSVNIYCADGHMARIRSLKRSITKRSVRDILKAADMVARPASDVRDLTELVDTEFEKRAQADFTFATKDTETETVTEIQRISGELTAGDVTTEFDATTP